jgi:hypothetical protein
MRIYPAVCKDSRCLQCPVSESTVSFYIKSVHCVLPAIGEPPVAATRSVTSNRCVMKPKYLNYKRAIEACIVHNYIIGKPFSPAESLAGRVRAILIAPYNCNLRPQLLAEVFAGVEPDHALRICRDGRYEVIGLPEHYRLVRERHRPKSLQGYPAKIDAAMNSSAGNCIPAGSTIVRRINGGNARSPGGLLHPEC